MAEFLIRTPGQPERRVPLGARTIVVGRHESCDVQILEVKASKRHFELAPAPGSTPAAPLWTVTDLQSSNGTLVEEARVLRRLLAPGDVVKVGDTTLVVVLDGAAGAGGLAPTAGPSAPAGLKISKGLVLDAAPAVVEAAGAAASPGGAAEADAPSAADDDAAADRGGAGAIAGPSPDERRGAAAGRRAISRGAVVLAIGVAALVGVEFGLGGAANRKARDRAEAAAYLEILGKRDEPLTKVTALCEDFRRDFPASARAAELEKLLDAKRREDERDRRDEEELYRVVARTVPTTDAEAFGALTALRERHGGAADPMRPRIEKELAALRARRDAEFVAERSAVRAEVARLLEAKDAGAAQRRLRAFAGAYPALAGEERATLVEEQAAVARAAAAIADAALAEAGQAADPDARRRVLLAAIRGLEGTNELDRVGSVLRRVTGGTAPAGGGPVAGAPRPPAGKPSGGPQIGLLSSDVLARIADAEALARGRKWFAAATAYDALLGLDASARIKADWTERRGDLGRVIGLVNDLKAAVAAAPGGRLSVPVGGATWDVVAIDEAGVKAKRSGVEETIAWPDVAPRDLVALLAYGAATPDRHLALATLAADLGDRPAAVEHLTPLIDLPSHRDLAFAVMAHRMEGRTSVPEGGYKALDGDLLDVAEWTRRTDARRLTELRAEAETLVRKAGEDPLFEKLKAVRAKREELDRRRAHALLAIFNEKHWPYPHDAPSLQTTYGIVTGECERRWKAVEEVWNDPAKATVPASPTLEKIAARHAEVLRELAAKEVDVEALAAQMEPFAIYAGAGTLTVRTFFRSKEEKELLAYNRWVMETYNPAHASYASETEVEQIRITNEYRTMMGFAFTVEPGPASVESIDAANVATILDQGKETARRPLRAVRIEERLCKCARAHSDDMMRRGFFSHFAPENKDTGEPSTSPMDRMAKAGYAGSGSENIATASNPMGAHLMWLHSSGHHRNILSPWEDMGMGFSGARATQNFGAGVSEPVIVEGGDAAAPPKRRKGDKPGK